MSKKDFKEWGAGVYAKDVNGLIPHYYTVENGHKEIINFLLGNRTYVINVTRKDGNTALHIATLKGNKGVAKVSKREKQLKY